MTRRRRLTEDEERITRAAMAAVTTAIDPDRADRIMAVRIELISEGRRVEEYTAPFFTVWEGRKTFEALRFLATAVRDASIALATAQVGRAERIRILREVEALRAREWVRIEEEREKARRARRHEKPVKTPKRKKRRRTR